MALQLPGRPARTCFFGSTVGQAVANPVALGQRPDSRCLRRPGPARSVPGTPNGLPTNILFGVVHNGWGFLGFLQAAADRGRGQVDGRAAPGHHERPAGQLPRRRRAGHPGAGRPRPGRRAVRGVRHPPELPADRARQRQDPSGGGAGSVPPSTPPTAPPSRAPSSRAASPSGSAPRSNWRPARRS